MISTSLKFRLLIRYIESSNDYGTLTKISNIMITGLTVDETENLQNAYTVRGKYLIGREYGDIAKII